MRIITRHRNRLRLAARKYRQSAVRPRPVLSILMLIRKRRTGSNPETRNSINSYHFDGVAGAIFHRSCPLQMFVLKRHFGCAGAVVGFSSFRLAYFWLALNLIWKRQED